MTKKILLIFCTSIFCISAFAYNAKELYTHLETVSFTKSPDVFYYFETDFNNDGVSEIWIAHNKSHTGGNGIYFHVYEKQGKFYEMLDETPTLDTRLLALSGKDASEKEKRIITYFKHSAVSGSLVSYKIKDGHIVEHEYQEVFPKGKDEELFSKIFSEKHNIVEEVPAKNFKKFLKDKGIVCPTADGVQVLGLDFGGTTGETLFLSNPSTSFAASDWLAFHRQADKTWKPLQVHPENQKLVFFCDFSFIRKIDDKKFLICFEQDAPRKTILRFYHISANKICSFEIKYICVDESDVLLDHPEAEHDYAFLEALNFDFDKDKEYLHYEVLAKKDLVQADGSIKIPSNLKLRKLKEIQEITLPKDNDRTKQFYKLLKESESAN